MAHIYSVVFTKADHADPDEEFSLRIAADHVEHAVAKLRAAENVNQVVECIAELEADESRIYVDIA